MHDFWNLKTEQTSLWRRFSSHFFEVFRSFTFVCLWGNLVGTAPESRWRWMGLSWKVNEDCSIQDESRKSSSRWSLQIQTFFGRLSFSRFNLAIQVFASVASLGKVRKVLSLFFFSLLWQYTAEQLLKISTYSFDTLQ